jgi:anaerobic magnesium-protoporphyrin IX monomethyl ester cyclase
MTSLQHVLLINPTMTSRRHARFPLAVMSLAGALEGRYSSTIIDGNVDRNFVSTAVRALDDDSLLAVGISVMGGPQLRSAIAVSKAIRPPCRSSGAAPSQPTVRTPR